MQTREIVTDGIYSIISICEFGKSLVADMLSRTPLHVALDRAKDYTISRTLIANGADLENRDVERKTPCHNFFNMAVGEVLLQHNRDIVDLQTCDNNGMSILQYAAWSSQSQPCHIFACIRTDDIEPFMTRDHLGRRMIHFAAQRGNIEVLRYLLNLPFNIDIDCKDMAGLTPLHYAAESKRVDTITLLVSKGANIHAVDMHGRTPMHRAATRNNLLAINCIAEIAGKGIIGKVDYHGNTPAQLAYRYRATAAAEYLSDIGNEVLRPDALTQCVLQTKDFSNVKAASNLRTCLDFAYYFAVYTGSLGLIIMFLILTI